MGGFLQFDIYNFSFLYYNYIVKKESDLMLPNFNKINEVIFDVASYLDEEISLSEARDLMYNDIGQFIRMLMKNKYVVTVWGLDEDLLKLEFNFDNTQFKSHAIYPIWVTKEEHGMIEEERKKEDRRMLKLP